VSNQVSYPVVETKSFSFPASKVQEQIITTRVVGVTFENRQEVIARLQIGDLIWLEREPDNRYDSNAIKVSMNNGEQIGYLNRYLAASIAPHLDRYGEPARGEISLLTGSSWDNYSLGVIISFRVPGLQDD
jgi:single-stranded-DNA-specific exonuclease